MKQIRVYLFTVSIIVTGWFISMMYLNWWDMFSDTWPISITMVFGSFIAGATAEGGGAVAFPVFTKLFGIEPHDAKVFSFMIQSFGMTMAGLFIYLRKIKVLWNVVFTALTFGLPGLVCGALFLQLPNPYPKLVFSFIAGVFGVFLIYNRWFIRFSPVTEFRFTCKTDYLLIGSTAFIGGMVSSVIGVGIDMLTFILLTLLYGINEKISTPTTVIIMGLLSLGGFFYHGVVAADIPADVWRYWMSCVPIVIFGAPLGAWVCSKIKRDQLLYLLLFLIAIDAGSTLWLIPITGTRLLILSLALLITSSIFISLLYNRTRFLAGRNDSNQN
ncbi:MAG: sulfite exporter TauE/SafE family protein [Balneolales bacterium]|nr:sulfite exporter TauE/SafE family protein [Balneolales bacterium]